MSDSRCNGNGITYPHQRLVTSSTLEKKFKRLLYKPGRAQLSPDSSSRHCRVVLGTMDSSRRGTRRFAEVLCMLMESCRTHTAAIRGTDHGYWETTVALRDQGTAGTTILTPRLRRYQPTHICRADLLARNAHTNRTSCIDTMHMGQNFPLSLIHISEPTRPY